MCDKRRISSMLLLARTDDGSYSLERDESDPRINA